MINKTIIYLISILTINNSHRIDLFIRYVDTLLSMFVVYMIVYQVFNRTDGLFFVILLYNRSNITCIRQRLFIIYC